MNMWILYWRLVAVVQLTQLKQLFPAWMEYNMNHNVMRFAQLASRVWGCAMDFEHPEITAKAGIRAFRDFLKSIGMPQTLAELGGKEMKASK